MSLACKLLKREIYSCSGFTLPRSFFFVLRFFLVLIRTSLAEREGFVFTRFFRTASASRRSATNFSTALALFFHWLLDSCDEIWRTRLESIRVLSLIWIVSFCASLKLDDAPTSNNNSTREETLFTFCPPGPLARVNWNCNSFSGIVSVELIWTCIVPLTSLNFIPLLRTVMQEI